MFCHAAPPILSLPLDKHVRIYLYCGKGPSFTSPTARYTIKCVAERGLIKKWKRDLMKHYARSGVCIYIYIDMHIRIYVETWISWRSEMGFVRERSSPHSSARSRRITCPIQRIISTGTVRGEFAESSRRVCEEFVKDPSGTNQRASHVGKARTDWCPTKSFRKTNRERMQRGRTNRKKKTSGLLERKLTCLG